MVASGEAAGSEASTWRRRVLPLSEYVAELRRGGKSRKYDGSASAPIPVPLFDGETEEEYEKAFIRTLTKSQVKRLKASPAKPPILGLRVHFARRRVQWFGRSNSEEECELDATEVESLAFEKLPRSALYEIKYVPKSVYEEEIRYGMFRRLKAMSRSKSYAMFGTVLPPIYMPRLLRETPSECEARFAAWLLQNKSMTVEELISHPDPLEERGSRIEFAAATTTQVEEAAKPSGSQDHGAQPEASLMEKPSKRVLPLTEYVAEIESGAKLNFPTPVPLFEGETEEEYEQAFFKTLTKTQQARAHDVTTAHNRALRLSFARRRAKWCMKEADTPGFEIDADNIENVCVDSLPRAALYNIRYVTRAPYEAQVKSGFFDRLKRISRSEMVVLFRNVVPPIYMPLAHDETPQQCENRFQRWLRGKKRVTLDQLATHADPFEERRCRIEFAAEKGVYHENSKKRKHEEQTRTNKKPKIGERDTAACAKGKYNVANCVACGCIDCLATGRELLRQGASRAMSCVPQNHDLTNSLVTHPMQSSKSCQLTTQYSADIIETELIREYEEINDQVVMNEKALEESAARLVAAPVTDIHETSQFLAENEEMSSLIDHEIGNRNAALALLIVWMWRKDVDQLRTMVNDPAATNVLHIHRASHHKCAALSSEMKEERQKVDELNAQLQFTADQEDLVSLVAKAEEKLQQLTEQRRREFVRLVRFDESLRVLVQELLTRV